MYRPTKWVSYLPPLTYRPIENTEEQNFAEDMDIEESSMESHEENRNVGRVLLDIPFPAKLQSKQEIEDSGISVQEEPINQSHDDENRDEGNCYDEYRDERSYGEKYRGEGNQGNKNRGNGCNGDKNRGEGIVGDKNGMRGNSHDENRGEEMNGEKNRNEGSHFEHRDEENPNDESRGEYRIDGEKDVKHWKKRKYEDKEGEADKDGEWKKYTLKYEEEHKIHNTTGREWRWKRDENDMKEEENARNAEEWGRWRRKRKEEESQNEVNTFGFTKSSNKITEETMGGEWKVNIRKQRNKRRRRERSDSSGTRNNETTDVDTDDNPELSIVPVEESFRGNQFKNDWTKKRTEETEAEKNVAEEVTWNKSHVLIEEINNSDNLDGRLKTCAKKENLTTESVCEGNHNGGTLNKKKNTKTVEVHIKENENSTFWKRWKDKSVLEMDEKIEWVINK